MKKRVSLTADYYSAEHVRALQTSVELLRRRIAELEAENALLKRALAMLTRSLEDAEAESTR